MRTPTLKQLGALVTVLDAGHFGEAARRLNVTQPTLSQQIKMLEENLGGPLIDRDGIRPTPLGKEIAGRARDILRDAADLVEIAREARGGFGGLVRLGVLPTIGPYLLPYVLRGLHERYPSLRLHVREDRPEPLTAGLRDGRFDVLLGVLPVGGASPGKSWVAERRLFTEAIRVGVPLDHPLAGRTTIGRDELAGEAMLTLGRGHPLHVATEAVAGAQSANVLTEFEGSSLDAIRQMVATGMGVALFPELYVRSEIARGDDVRVIALEDPIDRPVGLAWRASAPRAAQFEALADELMTAVAVAFPDLAGE